MEQVKRGTVLRLFDCCSHCDGAGLGGSLCKRLTALSVVAAPRGSRISILVAIIVILEATAALAALLAVRALFMSAHGSSGQPNGARKRIMEVFSTHLRTAMRP